MPTVSFAPYAVPQFLDNEGKPIRGGTLETYLAGTSTPAATYADSAGAVANPTAIQLDSAGRPSNNGALVDVRLDVAKSYRFVLKNAAGAVVRTVDNIAGGATLAAGTVGKNELSAGAVSAGAITDDAEELAAITDKLRYQRQAADTYSRPVSGHFQEGASILDFIPPGLHRAILNHSSNEIVHEWIQKALNSEAIIHFPAGRYNYGDTVIVGNRKAIIGAGGGGRFGDGTQGTVFRLAPDFPQEAKKPVLALNPAYADPGNNSYDIDRALIRGVSFLGDAPLDANFMVTDPDLPGCIDVTWTKDDIAIEDVYYRRVGYGLFKRDSTRSDVVHWGLRSEGGGAYQVYCAYEVFPSLGTIEKPDIQRAHKGILVESSNATSSTVWIKGVRAEIDRSQAVSADQCHVTLNSARAYIDGYFEGGARHIKVTGGGNSITQIGVSQFSRVNRNGNASQVGVPILWDVSGTASDLIGIGLDGARSENHEALIETGPSANGNITLIGYLGNTPNIFKNSVGSITSIPPLGISYFNPDRIRGGIALPTVPVYDEPPLWSRSSFGFYHKRWVKRINPGVGTHTMVSFAGRGHGRLVVSQMDSSSTSDNLHYVAEFRTGADGTVVAVETVNEASGNSALVASSANTFTYQVRNSAITTAGVTLEYTSEGTPEASVTWLL